jgi:hypothetical protein
LQRIERIWDAAEEAIGLAWRLVMAPFFKIFHSVLALRF